MNYKEKATILRVCSNKKGERCSHCPAFGQGNRNCLRNAMRDGSVAITDLLARAEAAEAEVSELRKRLAEAEAACAYHKYRRGEANTSTRGLALTAYGLRQKLAEVEAQRDEAVHDRMMIEQRIGELNARAEAAEADNKKLCAAMMQLKRTDGPERMSVIYELEYDSSMSHKTMEEVAGIFFRGLMDADLKLRGQKEE